MSPKCTHLDQIQVADTDRHYCEECAASGGKWLHLRLCLSCGHVGCCDSSPNRHASKHYLDTAHPLIRSIEPGETWIWCYVDNTVAGEMET
ncbi:MAG TPA: UBP-type zinc finger domain-containing protein [Herbaspirillum sp.]